MEVYTSCIHSGRLWAIEIQSNEGTVCKDICCYGFVSVSSGVAGCKLSCDNIVHYWSGLGKRIAINIGRK